MPFGVMADSARVQHTSGTEIHLWDKEVMVFLHLQERILFVWNIMKELYLIFIAKTIKNVEYPVIRPCHLILDRFSYSSA